MKTPETPKGDAEIHKRVEWLFQGMKQSDYDQLERFASHRLAMLGLHSATGQDLLHEAVHSVLLGLGQGLGGRHPRYEDAADMKSFMDYLRNVIKSVSKDVARHERENTFESLDVLNPDGTNSETDEVREVEQPAADSPDQKIELTDLRGELFQRLRARAPDRLHHLVDRWEDEFLWADRIPLNGSHRQYRADLRRLTQEILCEIDSAA